MTHNHLLEAIGRLSLSEAIKLRQHLEQQIRSLAIEAGPQEFARILTELRAPNPQPQPINQD